MGKKMNEKMKRERRHNRFGMRHPYSLLGCSPEEIFPSRAFLCYRIPVPQV